MDKYDYKNFFADAFYSYMSNNEARAKEMYPHVNYIDHAKLDYPLGLEALMTEARKYVRY